MASIKVTLRKVNKGLEQPISVRYSHPNAFGKSKDYFVAVGLTVAPECFKNGLVVNHPLAPESNEKIGKVVTRLRMAERNVSTSGQEPTVERVKKSYLAQPRIVEKMERLVAYWDAEGKAELEILEHELEELLGQVAAKKDAIMKLRQQLGNDKKESFVELIDVFIANRVATATRKNTRKRSRTSFASSTSDSYVQLQKEIMGWNPTLNIRAVTQETLEDFEAYMIGRRYLNSTTFVFMQKMEAILNHFQEDYQLSKDYRKYSFELPLPDDTVIFLTRAELKAFREVPIAARTVTSRKKLAEVKDLAMLMSETGLRFVDAALTRSDIKNGMIVKVQKKTGKNVYIPLTSRMEAILERHDYKLRGKSVPNWNRNFRKLLAETGVPTLFEDVTVKNYIGDEEVNDTRKKYEHCSAHTMRRTMINQCLMRNLRYDKITKMTGHKNFDVFQTYVDRNTNANELDTVFDFLDDEKLLEGVE